MKQFFKFGFCVMLAMCFASLVKAQVVSFNVKEQQTGEIHYVEVNLDASTIMASRSNGMLIYRKNFYKVEINEKGYIGFSFTQGRTPAFRPVSDGITPYYIITDQLMIGTKNLASNTAYQYRPVDTVDYAKAYLRLMNALDGDKQATAAAATQTEQVTSTSIPNNPQDRTFTVNGVSFKMIHVEGGTFMMGATSEQGSDADGDEKPVHQVTLSSFSIGETEVTQELWQAVMDSNPSYFIGAKRPVERVSWNDCQTFIRKLNVLTGQRFRLPTEAEWEYAARGGNKGRGYKYAGSNNIEDVAWYAGNGERTSHNVKTKLPNELGIYDMSGNVWEWCQDWYDSDYYSVSPKINPTGPASGNIRIIRGGGGDKSSGDCRVAYRNCNNPNYNWSYYGLRLAL